MLQLQQLSAGYGEHLVLKSVDIKVKKGEIVALIGPNGAGKSTVLKALLSLCDITQGNLLYEGHDVKGLPTYELIRRGIVMVNQGRSVFGDLTVHENLLTGAELVKDKMLITASLQDVYRRFPVLEEKKHKKALTLSGGQRQMLALGRALMSKPSLLLLDEPSLGLSPKLQKEIFAMICTLRDEGMAILIVEQNAKQALLMADRTYLLENGKIALTGGKELLKDKRIKNVYLGGEY